MSYLGNNPNKGSFFQQKFTGDGSTTAFTLLQSVTDGSQLIVTIGNVIQEEGNGKAYTASGTTLTFDSAPANNDAIVVRYLGRSLDTPTTYATQITYKYVATNAQTAFSGADANGNTLSYTIGSVDVYLNGVHLDTTDFTETNESTITLASGATTNDELVIVAKRTITLTDVVPKSAGGTFAGDVIAGGALTVNGAFTSQGIDDNADATAITIDSSERVGIGNTNPNGGKLHVTNSTGAIGYFQSTQSASNVENIILNSTQTNSSANLSFQINDGTTAKGQVRLNGDNSIAIHNTTSLTERLRINNDGNVLIGRTTELTDFGDGRTSLVLQGSGSQDYSTIQLGNNGTGSNNQILGLLGFFDGTNENARVQGQRGDGTDVGDLLFFSRSSGGSLTEAMRVYRDGNVGIGTTEPNFKFQVRSDNTGSQGVTDLRANSSSFTGNVLLVGSNTNTTNSTYNHMRADIHGVSQRFAIRDSGNVVNANNQYGALSDERLKENIVDANSQWSDIKALKIRRYNRIGEEQKEIGVIAQELEASNMSGLVEDGEYFDVKNNPDKETRKTVKYSILYMKAVKALQEAMTRIETLETKVTVLEGK